MLWSEFERELVMAVVRKNSIMKSEPCKCRTCMPCGFPRLPDPVSWSHDVAREKSAGEIPYGEIPSVSLETQGSVLCTICVACNE